MQDDNNFHIPSYNKLTSLLKIFLTPIIIYLLFTHKDIHAAVIICISALVSFVEAHKTREKIKIFSSITSHVSFLPVLIFLGYREIFIYPKFPILAVLGTFFITLKEIIIIYHDIQYIRNKKDYIGPLSTRKLNKIAAAVVILLYSLKLYPYNNLAMIAFLMIAATDSFGLLWNYFKRKRGIKDLNLATRITLFRLLMSPVFLIVFFYDRNANFSDNSFLLQIIAILFTVAFIVTDGLDGYFARKRNEVTKFGKYFDPFSDKICTTTIFLCFVASNYVPVWMVALIYYREASISIIRTLAAAENIVISARRSGKWKTALQATAIILILLLATILSEMSRTSFASIHPALYSKFLLIWNYLPFTLMGFVTVVTIISGLDYVISSKNILDKYFK